MSLEVKSYIPFIGCDLALDINLKLLERKGIPIFLSPIHFIRLLYTIISQMDMVVLLFFHSVSVGTRPDITLLVKVQIVLCYQPPHSDVKLPLFVKHRSFDVFLDYVLMPILFFLQISHDVPHFMHYFYSSSSILTYWFYYPSIHFTMFVRNYFMFEVSLF